MVQNSLRDRRFPRQHPDAGRIHHDLDRHTQEITDLSRQILEEQSLFH